MSKSGFRSGMAEQMECFIEYKEASGFQRRSFLKPLQAFDHFCEERGITDVSFTEDDASAWAVKRPTEAVTTHYSRVNFAKNFLIYLGRKGFNVFVPHDVKSIPTDFQPHIYTDDEVARYFRAVDTYVANSGRSVRPFRN